MENLAKTIKQLAADQKQLKSAYANKKAYVSKEFQAYALRLAGQLDDFEHKGIYLRLVKTTPRYLLEQAFSFAIDYPNVRNKGSVFMWKLKELKAQAKAAGKPYKLELSDKKKTASRKKPKKAKKQSTKVKSIGTKRKTKPKTDKDETASQMTLF